MPTRRNNSKEKEIHEGHIIKAKKFRDLLFLEETTKLVHHVVVVAAAAAIGGRSTVLAVAIVGATLGRRTRFLPVLLNGLFGKVTHEGSTNCSEESVVGLVASVTTGSSTTEGTHQTTLALLALLALWVANLLLLMTLLPVSVWSSIE